MSLSASLQSPVLSKRKWRDCPSQLAFMNTLLVLHLLPGSLLWRCQDRSNCSSNAACCTFLAVDKPDTNASLCAQWGEGPHGHGKLWRWDPACPALSMAGHSARCQSILRHGHREEGRNQPGFLVEICLCFHQKWCFLEDIFVFTNWYTLIWGEKKKAFSEPFVQF